MQQEVAKLSRGAELAVAAIYGGHSVRTQMDTLKRGVDFVVGTPGRIIDHLQCRTLSLDTVKCVVLDEADRMLDIGFRPDIERVLRLCPTERQTLLLIATMPAPIIALAKRYMHRPVALIFPPQAWPRYDRTILLFSSRSRQIAAADQIAGGREEPRQCIIFRRTKLGTQRLFLKLSRPASNRIRHPRRLVPAASRLGDEAVAPGRCDS